MGSDRGGGPAKAQGSTLAQKIQDAADGRMGKNIWQSGKREKKGAERSGRRKRRQAQRSAGVATTDKWKSSNKNAENYKLDT